MRRTACRASLALASVCLVLAFISPSAGAADDEVARPGVFSSNASARAVSINLDRTALLPVNDIFNFIALDGAGAYGSSSQQARASLLFPGNGLILGPSLACGTFGGMFPAQFKPILDLCLQYKYPLTVFADSFEPDGASVGTLALGKPTDSISGNAISANAHAGDDSTTTNAVIQDLSVLGIPPVGPVALPGSAQLKLDTSVVTVDNASSRTDERITKGVLITDGKVSLSGVKLVGGLIRIGHLVSESKVTDDGNGKRTATAHLDATGVTVAGLPAQITNKGLALAKPDNPTPLGLEKLNQVNKLLASLNIKFTALPTEENPDKNGAGVASVGGVLLELARDVQGLPTIPGPLGEIDPNGVYTLTVQLGQTGVIGTADASGNGDELTDVGGDDTSFDDSSDLGGDDGFVNFDDSGTGSDTGGGQALGGRKAPNIGTQPGALASTRGFADNFGGRIGFVYLALMFVVLSLCIAPRLAIPARFPGRKP